MKAMEYIRAKKNQFKDYKVQRQKQIVSVEAEELRKERDRQAELAKVMAEKQRYDRDVQSISEYNKKVAGPSTIQKLGAGLAKVMNRSEGKMPQPAKYGGKNVKGLAGISKGSSGLDLGVDPKNLKAPDKSNSPFMTLKGSPFRK